MSHKKNNHIDKVPICKDFLNGKCSFSRCWYRHELGTQINSPSKASPEKAPELSSESDFPPVVKHVEPPEIKEMKEIMMQAMNMITLVNKKMETLLT